MISADAANRGIRFFLFNIMKFVDFPEVLAHNGIILYAKLPQEVSYV